MTHPTLLLLHGWGFDARLWDPLAELLPGYRFVRWDRGYFGEAAEPAVETPVAAVGHSLGAMLLADRISAETPLIAINGFDRFTGEAATPRRVVDRMGARLAENPAAVLNDFRERCGASPVGKAISSDRLAADLALLAPVKDYPARHTSTLLAFEAVAEAVGLAAKSGAVKGS